MQTVTHDGRTTAYRRTGGGSQPVVYVHGSGATHRIWGHQYGPGRPRPAAALDLSGHGKSEDVTVPVREALDVYVEDVLAVLRATDSNVLAGNSLGGAVVLSLVLSHDPAPSLEAMILADTGAHLPVHPDLLEWLAGDFERAIEFLHRPDFLFHDPDPEWVERSKRTLRATGRAVTSRDFRVCDAYDVRDRLDEVDVPTLVVYGEHDRLTPPAWNEYLTEHIPDARSRELPAAAHQPMIEQPDAFNDAVSTFLEEIP